MNIVPQRKLTIKVATQLKSIKTEYYGKTTSSENMKSRFKRKTPTLNYNNWLIFDIF